MFLAGIGDLNGFKRTPADAKKTCRPQSNPRVQRQKRKALHAFGGATAQGAVAENGGGANDGDKSYTSSYPVPN